MLMTILKYGGQLSLFEYLIIFLGYVAMILLVMPTRELAKAWVATKLGDPTPRWTGGLKFAPLSRIDPMGVVTLFLFNIVFSRPQSIDPRYFRKPRRDMALVALTGPVANLLIAAVALALYRILLILPVSTQVQSLGFLLLVVVIASVSLGLAVFHLLPLPVTDGFQFYALFLPDRWLYTLQRYSQIITWVTIMLLFTDVLDGPIMFLRRLLGGLLCRLVGLPNLF